MSTIKIAIAEDHLQYRDVITSLLRLEKNLEILFEVDNGIDLLQKLKNHEVDIILLEYQMPVMNGLEALKQIKIKYPKIKIIINTSSDNAILEQEFIKSGATAFLLKDADFEIVISTINSIFYSNFQQFDLYKKKLI